MKNNSAVFGPDAKKALLKINPDALRGLHSLLGYDFQQDHTIAYIQGCFTINGALKAANAAADEKCLVSLLCIDRESHFRNDRLSLVTVGAAGSIEIDYRKGWRWNLEKFFTKGSFNEYRKSESAETFVIAQKVQYIHKPDEKPFDAFARYAYIAGKDRKTGDGEGSTWLSNIAVRALDGSNKTIELTRDGEKETYSMIVYGRQNCNHPQTYLDIIDKSGYLLPKRRGELKRRADALKREKAKSAYLLTENRAKVEELRGMIETRKQSIIAVLSSAKSADDMRAVESAIGAYGGGLRWIVQDFERFADRTERKAYDSIVDSERAYNSIKKALEG